MATSRQSPDDEDTGEFRSIPTLTDPDTPAEHRFLLSLCDHPDDDEMRMVYADWLEQHGQIVKAEFVRDATSTAHHGKIERSWRAIMSRTPIEGCTDVKFRFKCPKQWNALATTDNPTVRHCSTCNKRVFFCEDNYEIRHRAVRGECVAFCQSIDRAKALELYDDDLVTMMGEVE